MDCGLIVQGDPQGGWMNQYDSLSEAFGIETEAEPADDSKHSWKTR